jgi:hypothetical protein
VVREVSQTSQGKVNHLANGSSDSGCGVHETHLGLLLSKYRCTLRTPAHRVKVRAPPRGLT